jgi:hypothetical protein
MIRWQENQKSGQWGAKENRPVPTVSFLNSGLFERCDPKGPKALKGSGGQAEGLEVALAKRATGFNRRAPWSFSRLAREGGWSGPSS